MNNKVFCIGQPKTATTSLGMALTQLGFKHQTWNLKLLEEFYEGKLQNIFRTIVLYGSFDDLPFRNFAKKSEKLKYDFVERN